METPNGTTPATARDKMKAIVHYEYGSPDVLELREIDRPVVGDDQVLVRVHAASVNPADWHLMTGTPWVARLQAGLRKPKRNTVGHDVAGTVEAVGANVTRFQPGDEVFGEAGGTYAEYASAMTRPQHACWAHNPQTAGVQMDCA